MIGSDGGVAWVIAGAPGDPGWSVVDDDVGGIVCHSADGNDGTVAQGRRVRVGR